MSFKNVFNALYDQVKASSRLTYVHQTQFLKGFHEGIAAQEYTIIFEPSEEEEAAEAESLGGDTEIIYYIDIHIRVELIGATGEILICGSSDGPKKGILDFTDDIKLAIEDDMTLGYNRAGCSTSEVAVGTTFALTPTAKYISVSINGNTPTGYDTILCGESTLSGDDVASNIQTALRALGNHADDGYYLAECSFDNSLKQFSICTASNNPDQTVEVTAGVSDDCSAILGFDNPTEVSGRNITKIRFETVLPNNTFFPVRYRVLPIKIWEEINRSLS